MLIHFIQKDTTCKGRRVSGISSGIDTCLWTEIVKKHSKGDIFYLYILQKHTTTHNYKINKKNTQKTLKNTSNENNCLKEKYLL